MIVEFEIQGQKFLALNGGPQFKFSEAVSFQVHCDTQAEVDYFWAKLSAGGSEGHCGWLKDKFGLSWQVVPTVIPEMLKDGNPASADRVMKAMMQMRKIDIAALQKAQPPERNLLRPSQTDFKQGEAMQVQPYLFLTAAARKRSSSTRRRSAPRSK